MDNALLRAALLNGVRLDYGDILKSDPGALAVPDFSPGYLSRRDKLLKAPFQAARPRWRRVLRIAAVILLALALAAVALWANPTTQAWIESFTRENDPKIGMDDYDFHGWEEPVVDFSKLRPAYVPEGFSEGKSPFHNDRHGVHVTYETETGEEWIDLDILPLTQGGGIGFDNEHADQSEITVNGMKAQLYVTNTPGWPNRLLVFDENNRLVYYFDSTILPEELIRMAESLKPEELPLYVDPHPEFTEWVNPTVEPVLLRYGGELYISYLQGWSPDMFEEEPLTQLGVISSSADRNTVPGEELQVNSEIYVGRPLYASGNGLYVLSEAGDKRNVRSSNDGIDYWRFFLCPDWLLEELYENGLQK